MQCHDILIVIENAAVVPQRLAAAAALATRFGARLTGFFASGFPVTAAYGDVSGWEQLVDAFYDLVVVGQPNPDAGLTGAIGLRPEEIVLSCGRPVLVVPYAGEFLDVGREILVAWNGSRESARALHDAMFLLPEAETVTIIEIDPPAPGAAAPAASAAQVAAALTRRGIAAKAETETAGDIGVSDLLLSRAADLDVDLLVMGAYGHSRMREFILGGVSRDIFRHMTVPVLMSH